MSGYPQRGGTARKARKQEMSRKNTGEWKPAFIAYLREHPNVLKAAKAAGIERKAAYVQRERDPEFASAWDDAIGESIDRIEELAIENAASGDARWQTMMIFLLKQWKPERYKEAVQSEQHGEVILRVIYDSPKHDT